MSKENKFATKLASEIMAMRPGEDYGDYEPFMDCDEAYHFLSTALYDFEKCKETNRIICQRLDHSKEALSCPPIKAAEELEAADKEQLMSDDIFRFIEKAYYDAANCIDDKYWFALAKLYYDDRYAHVDFEKAVFCLQTAVEHGDGHAEVLLGKCYLYEEGVQQDYDKAFHLLVKGALLDFSGASVYLLGDMYLNGWYVRQDKPQAYQMYLRALDILEYQNPPMCADVYLRLADYELQEIGNLSSAKKSLRYYQESENQFYEQLRLHIRGAETGINQAKQGQQVARDKILAFHSER